jgi:hypothetical protein
MTASIGQVYQLVSGQWQCPTRGQQLPPSYRQSTSRITNIRSTSIYAAASARSTAYGTYQPGATTTGPNAGVTLVSVGGTPPTFDSSGVCTNVGTSSDYTATSNGQVISGLEVWGRINLGSFTGVTIRDCIIHGTLVRGVDTAHIIANGDNLGGATIIDSKIAGRPVIVPATYTPAGGSTSETLPNPGFVNSANEWCGGIRGGNYTIQRCEITNVSDGLNNPYNCLIEGNWIHGAWFNEWDVPNATTSGSSQANSHFYPYSTGTTHYTHADGIQFSLKKDVTIRGNFIGGLHVVGAHNAFPSQAPQIRTGDDFYNSCILMKQESTSSQPNYLDNILVENNWFYGAVCAINWPSDAYTGRTYPTVVFRNNRFLRASWAGPFYVLTPVSGGVPTLGDHTAGVSWPLVIPDPLVTVPGSVGWTGNVFDDTNTPVTISPGA